MNGFFKKLVSGVVALCTVSTIVIPASADILDNLNTKPPVFNHAKITLPVFSSESLLTEETPDFSDPFELYEHYDPTLFIQARDAIIALCESQTDFSEIVDLVNFLGSETVYIVDMVQLSYVISNTDMLNQNYQAEYAYSQEMYYTLMNELCTTLQAVVDYGYNDELAEAMGGQEVLDAYLATDIATDSDIQYSQTQSSLLSEYYQLLSTSNDPLEFAELYLETVKLNNAYAVSYGYNNYTELAYQIYERDYTIEEAQTFFNAVSTYLPPIHKEIVKEIENNKYFYDFVSETCDIDTALAKVGEYTDDISPEMKSAFDYMTKYKTYNTGTLSENPNRVDTAFVTYLSYFQTPYMFLSLDENYSDVFTLIHEFGHYNEAYNTPTVRQVLDLAETSSQGLEMLYMEYYDEMFGEEYKKIACLNRMENNINAIISGCIIAELEMQVYANENMTAQEVVDTFNIIYEKYMGETPEVNFGIITHIFEQPHYYISYATSGAACSEIWKTSTTNHQSAVDNYLELIKYQNTNNGFKAMLSSCGMNNVFEEETIADISETVSDILTYDVDDDFKTTAEDALLVLKIVAESEDGTLYDADVNSDDSVNAGDALEILQTIVK